LLLAKVILCGRRLGVADSSDQHGHDGPDARAGGLHGSLSGWVICLLVSFSFYWSWRPAAKMESLEK
jgi:hypothetical protein